MASKTNALLWLPLDEVIIRNAEIPPASHLIRVAYGIKIFDPARPDITPLVERARQGNILVLEERACTRRDVLINTWAHLCRQGERIPEVQCLVGGQTPYGRKLRLSWDIDAVQDSLRFDDPRRVHPSLEEQGVRDATGGNYVYHLPPMVKRVFGRRKEHLVGLASFGYGWLDGLEGACRNFTPVLNYLNHWNLGPGAPMQSWEEWDSVRAARIEAGQGDAVALAGASHA